MNSLELTLAWKNLEALAIDFLSITKPAIIAGFRSLSIFELRSSPGSFRALPPKNTFSLQKNTFRQEAQFRNCLCLLSDRRELCVNPTPIPDYAHNMRLTGAEIHVKTPPKYLISCFSRQFMQLQPPKNYADNVSDLRVLCALCALCGSAPPDAHMSPRRQSLFSATH
jgi:hypothetical protein